jgi:hypothetical protein
MVMFFELPNTISPGLKNFIYGLIYVHLIVFAIYIFLIIKDFMKKKDAGLDKFKKEAAGKLE